MAIRLHKLVIPWLLVCSPVWAERLPVPPVPPANPSPARVAQVRHQGLHSSTKAIWYAENTDPTSIPPRASTQLAKPAPVPDRDAQLPPDPKFVTSYQSEREQFPSPTDGRYWCEDFPMGRNFNLRRMLDRFRRQV